MNKKLMALAVAGALTAPGLAVAQVGSSPGITMYGRLDAMIMDNAYTESFNNRAPGRDPTINGNSKLKKGDIYSAGNALGLRGREDLGGGTSFWFQLETGVWEERLDTSTVTGNNWGGRNSAVGFTSDLGDISWGIWDAPYKQVGGTWNLVTSSGLSAAGIIMNNGDTTGALPNALCSTTISNTTGSAVQAAPSQTTCTTEAAGNGTAFSRRNNDSINYVSPVMAGVQVRLQTAMNVFQSPSTSPNSGNVAGGQLPKAKYLSGNVSWARGPLSVGVGYETHQAFREAASIGAAAGSVLSSALNADANAKDKGVQVGAKFDFGMGQVGVGYEKLTYGALDTGTIANGNRNLGKMDVTSYVVNGRLNAGPGAVFASYSTTPGGKSCFEHPATVAQPNVGTVIGSTACGSDGKAKMLTLGYDYILSKRTKFYAAYTKIDNGDGTSYFYIAGPAGNNGTLAGTTGGNGTASGIQAGTDVTTFGVGVQHTF